MYWIVLENRTMVENELRLVRNSMKSTSTGLCPKYVYDFQYPTLKSNVQGTVTLPTHHAPLPTGCFMITITSMRKSSDKQEGKRFGLRCI